MWSSVTLPRASNPRRRSGSSEDASARRPVTPVAPAAASRVTKSRRVTFTAARPSVPDAGDAHGLAAVEARQVQLELSVLDRVGGEHVRAERGHAPLHPLAHVPHVGLARPPRGEVAG